MSYFFDFCNILCYDIVMEEIMEKAKKFIRNFIVFLLLIVLTFYIALKDQDLSELYIVIKNTVPSFVIMGILSMCFYLLCEAINIDRMLKALGEKSTFSQNIKYALIGFFFSGITPAASGGQPMQIYFMYKDNINVANSTLVLLVNLFCMQIVTISMALISLCFNLSYMPRGIIALFVVGILLNLSALSLLIIAIFNKKLLDKLVGFIIKVMKFLKLKKYETLKEKLENEVEKYKENASYIKQHKKVILKNLITSYVQFFVFYSISYWVYRSFGLNKFNLLKITSLQSIVFATVSGIPSPGSVGVNEGAFIAIFRKIIPEKLLKGAMLLSRVINFYLFIIISGILVAFLFLKGKKTNKNDSK